MERENIYLPATAQTPEVVLDFQNNFFSFKGVSIPEDSSNFYNPIYNACKAHLQNMRGDLQIEICLSAIGTASRMMLIEVLALFENCSGKVRVKWCYDTEEILEEGIEFKELIEINFEFCDVRNIGA